MNTAQLKLQHSIEVKVQPRYLLNSPMKSWLNIPLHTVRIANNSEQSVRLLARHWIITDGNNTIREVEGEGVVGQQPDIMPGESYSYSSGAILSTKTGTMEGSYKMRSFEGVDFNAIIEPFGLVHPNSLQ